MIPAAGRDVQCSNCAHTWFEVPGASAAQEGEPQRRRSRPQSVPSPSDGAEAAPKPSGDRRKVDPSVADILREEAARETQKRQSETPSTPVESQSDLGLSEPPKSPRPRPDTSDQTTQNPAAIAAASVGAVAAATDTESRRERLPDIEEINSSLRSKSEVIETGTSDAIANEMRQRRSFRRAFLLVLLIFVALVAVYVQADAIKAAVPALSSALDSYVSNVNAGRIWLDETVRGLMGPAANPTATEG